MNSGLAPVGLLLRGAGHSLLVSHHVKLLVYPGTVSIAQHVILYVTVASVQGKQAGWTD
jgi:hypothetical protein